MAGAPQKWQDRVILAAEHGPELDQRAAELEFKERMHRDAAEAQAYREYRKKHHTAAAAHHLRGMKAAQGSGDMDEARKHGAMYELHMSKLGDDPWREPSPELKAAMGAQDRQAAHKFKAHHGDAFVVEEHKAKQSAKLVKKQLEELYVKAKALVLLRKAFPTDPTKPVASGVPADLQAKYKAAAAPSEQLASRPPRNKYGGIDGAHKVMYANLPRPSTDVGMIEPGKKPNKDQKQLAADIRSLSSEQQVELDQQFAVGAQPTMPPKFKVWPIGRLTGPILQADAFNVHQNIAQGFVENGRQTEMHPASHGDEAWKGTGKVDRLYDNDFWTSLGRAVGINKSELTKAFPTYPDVPVGSNLDPVSRAAIRAEAVPPEKIAEAAGYIHRAVHAEGPNARHMIRDADAVQNGNRLRPSIEVPQTVAPGKRPTKAQQAVAGMITSASPEQQVEIDQHLAHGATPSLPPKFKQKPRPNLATHGIDHPEFVAGVNVVGHNNEQREKLFGKDVVPDYRMGDTHSRAAPDFNIHGEWKKMRPGHDTRLQVDNAFWEALGRSVGINKSLIEIVDLAKAFPADPSKPFGHDIEPELERKYMDAAREPADIEGPPHNPFSHALERVAQYAEQKRLQDSNKFRPGKPINTAVKPGAAPTKAQAALSAAMTTSPAAQDPVTRVALDSLYEKGFQPEQPPKFEPARFPGYGGTPAYSANSPGIRTMAEAQRAQLNGRITTENSRQLRQHPDMNMEASVAPQPAMWAPTAWRAPTFIEGSKQLDAAFWSSLSRAVGLPHGEPISSPEEAAQVEKQINAAQMKKAFPTDPTKPVGHDLEPALENKYLTSSRTSEQLYTSGKDADNISHGRNWLNARMVAAANKFRPGTIAQPIPAGGQPTKVQQKLATNMQALSSEDKVAMDRMLESGFQPETAPPKFKPAHHAIFVPGSSQHNMRSLQGLVPSVEGQPSFADGPIEPAIPYGDTPGDRNAWSNQRSYPVYSGGSFRRVNPESPAQQSRFLDKGFWDSLNRAVGLPHGETISSPEEAAQMEQQLRAAQMKKGLFDFFTPKKPAGMHTPAPKAAGVAPGVRPYEPMPQADVEARKKIFASIPPKPQPSISGTAPTVASPQRAAAKQAAPLGGHAVPSAPAAKPTALPSTVPGYNRQETAGLQRILAATPRTRKSEQEPKGPNLFDHIFDAIRLPGTESRVFPKERAVERHASNRAKQNLPPHVKCGCGKCADWRKKNISMKAELEIVDLVKSQKLDTSSPVFTPGQLVGHEGRNLVVQKVHPGRGLGDPHLYTLRDPQTNTLMHAFEAKLTPTKDQNDGRDH